MDAQVLIENRVKGVLSYCSQLIQEASGVDWKTPAFPGASPVALTLWHVPRTLDWLVNGSARGVSEVADGPGYGELPNPDLFGFGTGLTPAQAVAASEAVNHEDLLRYVSEVGESVLDWLAALDPALLDHPVTEFYERQSRRPSYATPDALDEIDGLGGLPLGMLLVRPGVSHLFVHLGEANVLIQRERSLA